MITLKDIGKTKQMEVGIIKKGKPYIRVTSAKFECPSCGTMIQVLQLEKKFREPTRCSCGRRGGFKLLSKELTDMMDVLLRESDSKAEYRGYVEGGELIARINDLSPDVKISGEISDEYTPKLNKGELVVLIKDVKRLKK